MARIAGTRNIYWTAQEVETLTSIIGEQRLSPALLEQVAKLTGRTSSAVEGKARLIREGREGHEGRPTHTNQVGGGSFQAPRYVASDDAAHLKAIKASNDGYGFPCVTDPLLSRLGTYERSAPRGVEFWRPA